LDVGNLDGGGPLCRSRVRARRSYPPRSIGFTALGYSACGVQEIVDAAGVPKGSFYNYFKAKELLAVEVLGTYWRA